LPDALVGVPQGWTPDQIKQFQDYWDTEFAGDLAKRRRAKFVPGDTASKVHQTKEPEHKDDFDEWLARIICFAFSVPPQWATKVMNRATADNQSAQSEEEGLEPTKEWVKDLIDEIIAEEFASPDLELHWLDEDDGAAENEAALEGRVKLGALTLNEMRDSLGLDPFANPAADRPMVLTATGYVPIEANAGEAGSSAPANVAQMSDLSAETLNGAKAEAKSGNRNAAGAALGKDFNPDQPRVPAGNPDGGQWTSEDGNGLSTDSKTHATATTSYSSVLETRYAALDAGTQIDATNAPSGEQYAADPSRYSIDPSALTGISQIDDITKKLLNILVDASDRVGFLSGTPQFYGIAIHLEFADAVIAAGIQGISPTDVEQPFALPSGYNLNKKYVIPDVVLRDDGGDIVAIYDVKTGEPRLDPAREDEIRAATGVDSTVPVIILHLY
jgi:hypothetical protein